MIGILSATTKYLGVANSPGSKIVPVTIPPPVLWSVAIISLAFCGCDRLRAPTTSAAQQKIWEEFSGDRALAHVRAQVEFGPRPPGSKGIEEARRYLIDQLKGQGWSVTSQVFSEETPRGQVQFTNLIATFGHGEARPVFLLCSHYDTKLFDNVRFVGANDGGSSTGLLLELARVLAFRPDLAARMELVFFDGEEAYEAFTETDGLYGSRYFAKQVMAQGNAKQFRGGLLFDMVGDRSLTVTLPPDSPTQIAGDIFAAAEAVQKRKYFTYFDRGVTDDHTPLNAIGIPVIDLIDFDFPPWHTPDDTLDKISAESLQTVGMVASYYLSELALRR